MSCSSSGRDLIHNSLELIFKYSTILSDLWYVILISLMIKYIFLVVLIIFVHQIYFIISSFLLRLSWRFLSFFYIVFYFLIPFCFIDLKGIFAEWFPLRIIKMLKISSNLLIFILWFFLLKVMLMLALISRKT